MCGYTKPKQPVLSDAATDTSDLPCWGWHTLPQQAFRPNFPLCIQRDLDAGPPQDMLLLNAAVECLATPYRWELVGGLCLFMPFTEGPSST